MSIEMTVAAGLPTLERAPRRRARATTAEIPAPLCARYHPARTEWPCRGTRTRSAREQDQAQTDDPGERRGPGRHHVARVVHTEIEAREANQRDGAGRENEDRPAQARGP